MGAARKTMQLSWLIATTAEAATKAPEVDDNTVLRNVYIPLVIIASTIIFYGSKRSKNMTEMETMSSKDAMMFPIVGSCVLFGHFLIFGLFAVGMTILPAIQVVTGAPKKGDAPLIKFSFTIPAIPVINPEAEKTDVELFLGDLVAYPIGLAIAVWYATTKNWLANDVLGTAFCIQAIEMMSLGTYVNGVILLIGLFFYDIFWVFGTGYFMEGDNSVMVSVAKNFDARSSSSSRRATLWCQMSRDSFLCSAW